MNRAQLLDDALNLARAGKLDYSVALQVTVYLHHDEDYIPWTAALNAFSFLDRRLTNDQGHEDFKVHSHFTGKLLSFFLNTNWALSDMASTSFRRKVTMGSENFCGA